jgi:hypothetical protein
MGQDGLLVDRRLDYLSRNPRGRQKKHGVARLCPAELCDWEARYGALRREATG